MVIIGGNLLKSISIPRASATAGLMPDLEDLDGPIHHAMPCLGENYSGRRKTFLNLSPYNSEDIGPASFDFRLGGLVAKSNKLKSHGMTTADLLQMDCTHLSPGQEYLFEADPDGRNIYYYVSHESVEHSTNLEVEVHAKSTTGRLGCQTKDVGRTLDGKIISVLQLLAFNLLARSGETSFGQGVVRYAHSNYATPKEILEKKLISCEGEDLEKSLNPFGARIRFNTCHAYAAKRTSAPIDMSAKNLDWEKWWELIKGNATITLEGKRLYLLGSKGNLTLHNSCGIISKEQTAFNGLGGFGCLAGVVQPGWNGEITMEPYFPLGQETEISNGDLAGYILIDPIEGTGTYTGNYQGQKAPKLPKMFTPVSN